MTFSRYETHYFCGCCNSWSPHKLGNYCPVCGRKMRSRPRDPELREKYLGVQMRKFTKNHRRIYRILDDEKYRRFWWGRRPSTKPIFEEWLVNPRETMHSVAMRHGKSRIFLQVLSRALRREGIMDIIKHELEAPDLWENHDKEE